ncbi:unnamed protein product [Cyprideis torosa]|uniref:Uncharacterized protein n=1 Tax=Cyprideis torosa TaxID=163714 RepID=A0A7R8W383_9CRUS|nr:unnamed protein product [Cyprideis torosa]CAG0882744.1 unnamed protein product [Cyprideis torosa]
MWTMGKPHSQIAWLLEMELFPPDYLENYDEKEHLIHLLDSPGHVDFCYEVDVALATADGALILVDCVEGVCPQTVQSLRGAYRQRLTPILVLNKIDRLITEQKLDPLDAYFRMVQIVEQVNVVMGELFASELLRGEEEEEEGKQTDMGQRRDYTSALEKADDSDVYFQPSRGNVLFGSALHGWTFSISNFVTAYSKILGVDEHIIREGLWGDCYYNKKQKKILTGAHEKGKKPLFVQCILDNLWHIYDPDTYRDPVAFEKVLKTLGITLNVRDMREKDTKLKAQAVLSQWLPAAKATLDAVVHLISSPVCLDARRAEAILGGEEFQLLPRDSQALKGDVIRAGTTPESPVICVVAKMIAVDVSSLPENRPRVLSPEELAERRGRIKEIQERRELERQKRLTDFEAKENGIQGEIETSTPMTEVREEEDKNKVAFIAFTRILSGTLKPGLTCYALGPKHDPKSALEAVCHIMMRTLGTASEENVELFSWPSNPSDKESHLPLPVLSLEDVDKPRKKKNPPYRKTIDLSDSNLPPSSRPRPRCIRISNLMPSCDEERVRGKIGNGCISVKDDSPNPKWCRSFIVKVDSIIYDKVRNPNFWPSGIFVKPFFPRREKHSVVSKAFTNEDSVMGVLLAPGARSVVSDGLKGLGSSGAMQRRSDADESVLVQHFFPADLMSTSNVFKGSLAGKMSPVESLDWIVAVVLDSLDWIAAVVLKSLDWIAAVILESLDWIAVNRGEEIDPSWTISTLPAEHHATRCTLGKLYLMVGREMEPLEEAAAGNIVGIGGLEGHILKFGALSSTLACPPLGVFSSHSMRGAPILKVAVEPKIPKDLPMLIRGLQLLNQADPCVQVTVEESGEHCLMTAGEVHLQRCVTDLEEQFSQVEVTVSAPIVPLRETIVPPPVLDKTKETISVVEKPDKNKPSHIITLSTPNRRSSVTVTAIPLPEAVTSLLDSSVRIIRLIQEGKASRDEKDGFRKKLEEAFHSNDREEISEEWEQYRFLLCSETLVSKHSKSDLKDYGFQCTNARCKFQRMV